MEMIVVWPLEQGGLPLPASLGAWPTSAGIKITGPERQVGKIGNSAFVNLNKTQLDLGDEPIKFLPGITMREAVLFSDSKRLNFLLGILNIDPSNAKVSLGYVRNVGDARLQKAFKAAFGVSPQSSEIVRATAVLRIPGVKRSASVEDGLLKVSTGSSDFSFRVQFGYMAAAVAAERMILDLCTDAALNSGFFAGRARKVVGLARHWLTISSSDSTSFLNQQALLRESLNLDGRHLQVQRVLEDKVGASNRVIAAFTIALGLSATAFPLFGKALDLITLPSWGILLTIGVVAVASSLATWALTRSK